MVVISAIEYESGIKRPFWGTNQLTKDTITLKAEEEVGGPPKTLKIHKPDVPLKFIFNTMPVSRKEPHKLLLQPKVG